LQLHKRSKTGQLCHLAGDEITDLVFCVDFFPRIIAQLLDPKTDALVDLINVDHHCLDLVIFLKYLAGVVDLTSPAQIGNVNHSIDSIFQFDEGSIGGHVANGTLNMTADGKSLLDFIPWIRLELAQT